MKNLLAVLLTLAFATSVFAADAAKDAEQKDVQAQEGAEMPADAKVEEGKKKEEKK